MATIEGAIERAVTLNNEIDMTSDHQWRFMSWDAANNRIKRCDADDIPVGILLNAPTATRAASVAVLGAGVVAKAVAGAAVSEGALVKSDGEGRAIAVSAAGDYVGGQALAPAAAAGEVIPILLGAVGVKRG